MPVFEPEFPRIWAEPDIMGGVPCIRGTRIPVYIVVGKLGYGMSIEELLREYPALSREDVLEALRFAARAAECGFRQPTGERPMRIVDVRRAQTYLSRLLEAVRRGEEVVIARAGVPVARLVPVAEPRRLGRLAGRLRAAEDFDAPLPEDVPTSFEGRD